MFYINSMNFQPEYTITDQSTLIVTGSFFVKNTGWGRGRGGGLNREGGLINFPPVKRGGAYLRGGGLIEDLRYDRFNYLIFVQSISVQYTTNWLSDSLIFYFQLQSLHPEQGLVFQIS